MHKILGIVLYVLIFVFSCDNNPTKSKYNHENSGLKIISPENGEIFTVGEQIEFIYEFIDKPDTYDNFNIFWYSNIDDYFSGDSVCLESKLSIGKHQISVEAIKNYQVLFTDSITINIEGFENLQTTELCGSIQAIIYNNKTIPIQTKDRYLRYLYDKDDFYYVSNLYGINREAKYWKNCQKIILPSKPIAEINSLFVNDNDVFACGIDRDSIGIFARACYWKNDEKYYLSDTFSVAQDICFYNNKVFVCGEEESKACFWINGEKHIIGDKFSKAKFIRVNESGVYIGCEDQMYKYDYGVTVGWYWYDGIKTYLFYNENSPDIEFSGTLNDMVVINDNVYITGRDNWKFGPVYWLNNSIFMLKPFYGLYTNAYSFSIEVIDGNIIVGGNNDGEYCVWINGIRADFSQID